MSLTHGSMAVRGGNAAGFPGTFFGDASKLRFQNHCSNDEFPLIEMNLRKA